MQRGGDDRTQTVIHALQISATSITANTKVDMIYTHVLSNPDNDLGRSSPMFVENRDLLLRCRVNGSMFKGGSRFCWFHNLFSFLNESPYMCVGACAKSWR